MVYATDYINKPNKKVSLAEIGDKVRTPDTNPEDFTKKGANYINKNTGEIWQKSHTNHSGDSIGEWKVGINDRPPTKNNKITIRRSNNEITKITQWLIIKI